MTRATIYSILLLLSVQILFAQTETELLLGADKHYEHQDFIAAEELYRKAREKESSLASNFNLGNATFKQERYEEAVEHYLNATRKSDDKITESDIHYNLGNAYFQNQKMDEAIDAYKQAIRLNPANEEARYNLAYLKEIKKMMQQQPQEQQQQQQENSDEQQDQENQENQEQQEQQDQENSDQQNQDEQEQQDQQEAEQDSTQQEQDSQGGSFDSTRLEKQSLDSIDAAKLLQIIQAEEKKVQEKLRKFNSNRKKPDKDW